MDFNLSDEQTALGEAVARYAARNAAKADWKSLAGQLGLGGLLLPGSSGGQAGGPVEMMVVMEALGSTLLASPFVETAVMAAGLLDNAGGKAASKLLPAIVEGSCQIAVAWAEEAGRYNAAYVAARAEASAGGWTLKGRKSVVTEGPDATHFLVSARTTGNERDRDGVSLFLLPADAKGLKRHDYPTVDGRRACDLVLEDVHVDTDGLIGKQGSALEPLELAIDRATTALAAEAVGVMRRAHAETLAYTRQRRQFGQPIADFQVIQHRLVDMYIAIDKAVSAVYLAVLKLGRDRQQRQRAVSTAKVVVNQSARFVGQNAIQLHGGMGMVDELLVGKLFKRLTAIENSFGTTAHHLARHAATPAIAA